MSAREGLHAWKEGWARPEGGLRGSGGNKSTWSAWFGALPALKAGIPSQHTSDPRPPHPRPYLCLSSAPSPAQLIPVCIPSLPTSHPKP